MYRASINKQIHPSINQQLNQTYKIFVGIWLSDVSITDIYMTTCRISIIFFLFFHNRHPYDTRVKFSERQKRQKMDRMWGDDQSCIYMVVLVCMPFVFFNEEYGFGSGQANWAVRFFFPQKSVQSGEKEKLYVIFYFLI